MPTPYVFIVEHGDRNISSTVNTLGANQLVATPGQNYRIVVTSFSIQNETQNATTMILQDGAGHDAWRCYAAGPGNGLAMSFPSNHPWKLRANQPLVLDLSGANSCGYSIQYYVEKA